jgi:hypothetical protein
MGEYTTQKSDKNNGTKGNLRGISIRKRHGEKDSRLKKELSRCFRYI